MSTTNWSEIRAEFREYLEAGMPQETLDRWTRDAIRLHAVGSVDPPPEPQAGEAATA